MIYAIDLRENDVIEYGGIMQVLSVYPYRAGKSITYIRTQLRDLNTGVVLEHTFPQSEKFPRVTTERKKLEFLYSDGELCFFMDMETYEQIPIAFDSLGRGVRYLKEFQTYTICFYKDKVFAIIPPTIMELVVTETVPPTVPPKDGPINITKAATLETGAVIQVPLFVRQGETIKVDTRTGECLGRV